MWCVSEDEIKQNNYTQQETILLHLLRNGYVTNKECCDLYGFRHLPSIIRDLKENYFVEFQTIKQKSLNRFKQKTDYVEYHIMNAQYFKDLVRKIKNG